MARDGKKITPVIMAGGAGTRLWPISRSRQPKQFLPLLGQNTMFQDTLLRFRDLNAFLSPYILTRRIYKDFVIKQCEELGVRPSMVFLEPEIRNTGIAIAIAAAYSSLDSSSNDLILVTPSDHAVSDLHAYRQAIEEGAVAAQNGNIVTFGITPTYPETGYGYIRLGSRISGQEQSYHVEGFFEKPSFQKALNFIETGKFAWNSGMFMARADTLLKEIEDLSPEIFDAASRILEASHREGVCISPDKKVFASAPNISFDCAVMEKTRNAVVVSTDMGWSDVGSWPSLAQRRQIDAQGNSFEGKIVASEVKNSTIFGARRLIALQGVEDIIVADTDEALLIVNKNSSQGLKTLVDQVLKLSDLSQDKVDTDKSLWGCETVLSERDEYKINHLIILADRKTVRQYNKYRSVNLLILAGIADVLINSKPVVIKVGQSLDVPLGSEYTLSNATDVELHLLEIQFGKISEP
ncbi:MAG: mannose-1-phosphate guanylyltransferase/mannose-6-phosphate isomerase [Micavibrio sp.]|nr:mannose-1-phosphate guanylyltransferase/mannose-6-phosphate isomerase [Micavibrio sp.]